MAHHRSLLVAIGVVLAGMATLGSAIALLEYLSAPIDAFLGRLFGADNPSIGLLRATAYAALFILAVVVVLLAARLSAVTRSRATGRANLPEQVRLRYLTRIRKEIEQRLRASIHHHVIALQHHERIDAVNPFNFLAERGAEPERTFSVFSECFEHFDRRVLLLGDPGSGKSTTLLLFAERLVADALDDPNRPVPLLANLAQMQAGETRKTPKGLVARFIDRLRAVDDRREDRGLQDRLAQLVAKEVHVEGLDAEIVDDWIEEGRVVLLLDGLDEVDDGRRALLADDLNCTLLDRHSQTPTVIASRVVEYRVVETEGKHLRLDGAVTLQPLSDAQIADYLERAGASGLRRALPDDSALKELARAPLTLSMMTLAYQGLEPAEIRADLAGLDRRHALFDHFVDRMMQREAWRRAGRPWDPRSKHRLKTPYTRDRIDRYLGWLATALSRRALFRFDGRNLPSLLAGKPVFGNQGWSDQFLLGQIATSLFCSTLMVVAFASFSQGADTYLGMIVAAIATTIALPVIVLTLKIEPPKGALAFLAGISFVWACCSFLLLSLAWTNALSVSLGIPPGAATVAPVAILYLISWLKEPSRKILALFLLAIAAAGLWIGIHPESGVTRYVQYLQQIFKGDWSFGEATGFLCIIVMFGELLIKRAQRENGKARPQASGTPGPTSVIVLFLITGLVLEAAGSLAAKLEFLRNPVAFTAIFFSSFSFLVAGRWYQLAAFTMIGIAVAGSSGNHEMLVLSTQLGLGFLLLLFVLLSVAISFDAIMRLLIWHNRFWKGILSDPFVTLAVILQRRFPLRSRRFIRYATEILVLRKNECEFEFCHLLLRDHFAVRSLIPALLDSRTELRHSAISDLARQGDAALDTLETLCRDKDDRVKEMAVEAMVRIPSEQVAERIRKVIRSEPNAEVRAKAVAGIDQVDESQAIELLREIEQQEDHSAVRAAAARCLFRLTSTWDQPRESLVQQFLNDPDEEVRLQTIFSGVAGSRLGAVLTIASVLSDQNPQVVRAALLWHALHFARKSWSESLSQADRNRIAPILLKLLGGLEDDDEFLSFRKVQQANTAESLAALTAETLGNVAQMLGELGYQSAVPRLCELCRHPRALTREAVVRALGDMPQGPDSVSALVARLWDTSLKVRFAALKTIHEIASELGWNSLSDALRERASFGIQRACRDRRPWLRAAGVRALELLPADLGAPLLRRACRDRATSVRNAALETMARIDADHFVAEIVPLLAATGTRDAAIKALLKARSDPGVEALLGLLASPPSRKQAGALLALGEMRARGSVPAIRSLLERTSPRGRWRLLRRRGGRGEQLRKLCVQTLVRIGDPSTVSDIDQSLRDGDLDGTLSKRLDEMRRARI
jgi:HEAT repeat protein